MESKKCIVWDLDNTLWKGTFLEDENIVLNDQAIDVIDELDRRGILHSIASKNDPKVFEKLKELNIDHYFLFPQINWGPKSVSIAEIAKKLNININSVAFVDDLEYERKEVEYSYPQVLCLDADVIGNLLKMEAFTPRFITENAKNRRLMYQQNIIRTDFENKYNGPKEGFVRELNIRMTISKVTEEDLKRVEELTVRTHQLNTTGYTYSYEELRDFLLEGSDHLLLVAGMEDRFGDYGKIGIALIHCGETVWNIKLFLMSCRVMSRGVGQVFLSDIVGRARAKGVRLQAAFNSTGVNRMMLVTYRFHGFNIVEENEGKLLLEHDFNFVFENQDYVELISQ